MLKRQLGALFLVICLSLTTVPAVLGGENKHVIILLETEVETSTAMEKTITSRLTRLLIMLQAIRAQLSTLKVHLRMK